MKKETLNMIGLAKRAGKIKSGGVQVEQALKKREARLVISAADASDNSRKHIRDKCLYRRIPLAVAGEKAELGHALGQEDRSCLAVTDENLARAIIKLLEEEGIKTDCQGV